MVALSNSLLAGLAAKDLEALEPCLTSVALRPRQVLHRQGEKIRYVYFPNDGIISMATVLTDGAAVEAATIGREGVVGIGAFLTESSVSPCQTIVQVPVSGQSAVRMSVVDFRRALTNSKSLHDRIADFALALYSRMSRLTACNARHAVLQRCARWLLTADDHMSGRDFHLSQEFLAVMLGVRRQAVSPVVQSLRRAGAIRHVRGKVAITERPTLEKISCECYRAIATSYTGLRTE